ncbi:MAG: hypothetical protein RMK92_11240, partial [Armatimonadota bacterium]|nr:hypothetical protein [Armatimonadota bacterium]
QRSKEENDRAFQELRESLQRSKEENDRANQELREFLERSRQELQESLQRSKEENERAHQEMREYFRRVQEEHDRMIQQMREEQQETERRRRELEERTERRFQELMAEMRAFSQRLDRVERDVAELKGYRLEDYYRDNATAILGRYFRSLKVLDKGEYLQRINEQAPLSDEEWKQLVSTDLLLRGRHWSTGTDYLMVWEISWKIDRSDVLRAVQRAELLRRWEENTLPVVAGKTITVGAQRLAQQSGVFVVLETSVINGTSLSPRG